MNLEQINELIDLGQKLAPTIITIVGLIVGTGLGAGIVLGRNPHQMYGESQNRRPTMTLLPRCVKTRHHRARWTGLPKLSGSMSNSSSP